MKEVEYTLGYSFPNPKPPEGSFYVREGESDQKKFFAMFHGPGVKIFFEPSATYDYLAGNLEAIEAYSKVRSFLLEALETAKSVENIFNFFHNPT